MSRKDFDTIIIDRGEKYKGGDPTATDIVIFFNIQDFSRFKIQLKMAIEQAKECGIETGKPISQYERALLYLGSLKENVSLDRLRMISLAAIFLESKEIPDNEFDLLNVNLLFIKTNAPIFYHEAQCALKPKTITEETWNYFDWLAEEVRNAAFEASKIAANVASIAAKTMTTFIVAATESAEKMRIDFNQRAGSWITHTLFPNLNQKKIGDRKPTSEENSESRICL